MLKAQLEALLFIAGRPITLESLALKLQIPQEEVEKTLEELAKEYETQQRGFDIIRLGNEAQLSTSPEYAKVVEDFLKEEVQSELTRPSLEVLTILSYRGPMTKADLENIRGINCSLILRNLLMKGLVVSHTHQGVEKYQVSFEFLKILGLSDLKQLPEYEELNKKVETLVAEEQITNNQ